MGVMGMSGILLYQLGLDGRLSFKLERKRKI